MLKWRKWRAAYARRCSHSAALAAMAHAKGTSTDALVREAIARILGGDQPRKPKKSAYGLLAKYGPGPTEEEIDENRREMFRGLAKDLG